MSYRSDFRFCEKAISEINLAPFVGVLLVICCLLAGAQWSRRESVAIDIDQRPFHLVGQARRSPVVISLASDGKISVTSDIYRGGFVEIANQHQLAEPLRRALTATSWQEIYVRAEADVLYDDFFQFYSSVEKAGFEGQVRFFNEDIE